MGDPQADEQHGSVSSHTKIHLNDNHEIFPSGIWLAMIGGFLDAYTYILHDGVFANAQTGNMVLFAIYLAEGSSECLKYFIQIIAFLLGIIIADLIQQFIPQKSRFKSIVYVSLFEFVVILIIGFLPKSIASEWICSIVAFVNALQAAVFRKIGNNVCCTTMCTGNLRSVGDNLIKSIATKDLAPLKNSGIYLSIIISFMAGGVISKLLCIKFKAEAIWFCDAILLINLLTIFINHQILKKNILKEQKEQESQNFQADGNIHREVESHQESDLPEL